MTHWFVNSCSCRICCAACSCESWPLCTLVRIVSRCASTLARISGGICGNGAGAAAPGWLGWEGVPAGSGVGVAPVGVALGLARGVPCEPVANAFAEPLACPAWKGRGWLVRPPLDLTSFE